MSLTDPAAPLGIVGDGRMARHFTRYLQLSGIPHRSWSRRMSAEDLPARRLAGCRAALILISDDAIEPFLEQHAGGLAMPAIHFSGSLVTPRAVGMHPLGTFADPLYDLSTYRSIAFVCDPRRPAFEEVFPELPNPHFTLDAALRPLYHALCVLAGNFTTILWEKLFLEFEGRLGLPREAAHPYLASVAATLRSGGASSLTGPLARGDQGTVRRNLEALADDDFGDVYRAFVRVVAPRLLSQGQAAP